MLIGVDVDEVLAEMVSPLLAYHMKSTERASPDEMRIHTICGRYGAGHRKKRFAKSTTFIGQSTSAMCSLFPVPRKERLC